MGKKSQPNYDQPRDRRYSAYVYDGRRFVKSTCTKREKGCLKWKREFLDLSIPEDALFVKAHMILISEGEL
jgi:hypothetical protein